MKLMLVLLAGLMMAEASLLALKPRLLFLILERATEQDLRFAGLVYFTIAATALAVAMMGT